MVSAALSCRANCRTLCSSFRVDAGEWWKAAAGLPVALWFVFCENSGRLQMLPLGADAERLKTLISVSLGNGGGVTSGPACSLVLDNQMTHDGEMILKLEGQNTSAMDHPILTWLQQSSSCLLGATVTRSVCTDHIAGPAAPLPPRGPTDMIVSHGM